jgi:hypothetical protein
MPGMKNQIIKGWVLRRPTGEVMLSFVRQTKTEVIASVAEHFPGEQFRQQWRTMKSNGFNVIRVQVRIADIEEV